MAKLIILRGNSGSGKTSVSKALQKRFGRNTMVISQDMVRREMLWVKDGANTKALPLLINLLEYGRKNSEITILEGILDSECYRPLFQKAVEEYGKDIVLRRLCCVTKRNRTKISLVRRTCVDGGKRRIILVSFLRGFSPGTAVFRIRWS